MSELPKLTEAELRLVRRRLLEIAAQNQDIDLCNQAALDAGLMLDRMERDDANPVERRGCAPSHGAAVSLARSTK